jgi:vancomycin permeability regulator SanA
MSRISLRNGIVRFGILVIASAFAAASVLSVLFAAEVRSRYADREFQLKDAPVRVYGVVLGASVDLATSEPGIALRDRLDTAIDLLRSRTIMGVVVTGDDGKWKSNEIKGMVDYLHSKNVPDEVIFVDGGAYRTYESCMHLKEKGFTNVLLITQQFHLPRALYLCNKIGVDADGVIADKQWYSQYLYYWGRDFLASPFAYFDVRGVTIIEKGPSV